MHQSRSAEGDKQSKANSCHIVVQEKPRIKRNIRIWTSLEDQKLLELSENYGRNWKKIAEGLPSRNQNQCLHRYRRLSSTSHAQKTWTIDDDETIKQMVRKHGYNWKLIAEALGKKTGKQIRERYINRLDPSINRTQWTEQEDLLIISQISKHGPKWSQISQKLQGRPENRIKNRYYSHIKRNYTVTVNEGKSSEKNQQGDSIVNSFSLQREPSQLSEEVAGLDAEDQNEDNFGITVQVAHKNSTENMSPYERLAQIQFTNLDKQSDLCREDHFEDNLNTYLDAKIEEDRFQ